MEEHSSSEDDLRSAILREIEDTEYAYHVYPHMGCIPDFFVRYWDLAEVCCKYFDVPFHKPKLSKKDEVK
jgi:hypothetical protein